MTTLWTEKYRPQTMEDYVSKNEALRQKMEEWIRTGDIHILDFWTSRDR
ncbi:UNVERIFIED_ORG: hypothetical protein [Escherichia phage CMSTMSU]